MWRVALQVVCWGLPWRLRRMTLMGCFGYKIDPTARIGFSIILPRMLIMHANAYIGNLTICKPIDRLELCEKSGIGSLNFITGISTVGSRHFLHIIGRRCELVLARHAHITMRHLIDCNGGVYIGEFATVAGYRSQILTHSIDVYANQQDAKPVHVGRYCFVGTGCIFLPGSTLPDYCVLGAGAVLNKAYCKTHCLYAGSPARVVKQLEHDRVKFFQREDGFVY